MRGYLIFAGLGQIKIRHLEGRVKNVIFGPAFVTVCAKGQSRDIC
jgi:hypothetical protein